MRKITCTLSVLFLFCLAVPVSGQPRNIHYRPDNGSVSVVDGQKKYIRGLYGANSGFRMECSDMPVFGLFKSKNVAHLEFNVPEDGSSCKATYMPGMMHYTKGNLSVDAEMERERDIAVWRVSNTSKKSSLTVNYIYGELTGSQFSRNGDLGKDPADGFDLSYRVPEGSVPKYILLMPGHDRPFSTLYEESSIVLEPGGVAFFLACPPGKSISGPAEDIYWAAVSGREAMASQFVIDTPDEYINPIGAALNFAEDGIYGEDNVYLHGAVGWRSHYLGWRGAYSGDALGLHERTRMHIRNYATAQITDIPPVPGAILQLSADPAMRLARTTEKLGMPMFTDGYISNSPGKNTPSHYDMNLVYVDELLRHVLQTGDADFMREVWPVLTRHIAWEKRNFDIDGDHLYDAYCCIWASDGLYYSGGGVTHSTAYNYYANKQMARIAEVIGEDPAPFLQEAQAIYDAASRMLWVEDEGHWAEYLDFKGLGRLHKNAGLWTAYHAIDSELGDPFKDYATTMYIERHNPRHKVESPDIEDGYEVLSTTDWSPYFWSVNNVCPAEMLHTALAFWQAGRNDEAFRLMKSTALDNMYLGASPLNFGQTSFYDEHLGETYRDFADVVGIWSRAMAEGLFGIRPDLLEGVLNIVPGFPSDWDHASVSRQDVEYSFMKHGRRQIYEFEQSLCDSTVFSVDIPQSSAVRSVKVDGKKASWSYESVSFDSPEVKVPVKGPGRHRFVVRVRKAEYRPTGKSRTCGPVTFREMAAAGSIWWSAEDNTPSVPEEQPVHVPANATALDISSSFNANIADIYRNSYVSPRPSRVTLQIPVQGIGEWCVPTYTVDIVAPAGKNVAYASLWDNYPDSVSVKLPRKPVDALRVQVIGSTNHMQYDIANAELVLNYTDGTSGALELVHGRNYISIEQEKPYKVNEIIIPADRSKTPESLTLRVLSNDIVTGIAGVELLNE